MACGLRLRTCTSLALPAAGGCAVALLPVYIETRCTWPREAMTGCCFGGDACAICDCEAAGVVSAAATSNVVSVRVAVCRRLKPLILRNSPSGIPNLRAMAEYDSPRLLRYVVQELSLPL